MKVVIVGVAIASSVGAGDWLIAQDQVPDGGGGVATPASLSFDILYQNRVTNAGHVVTYNLVSPPTFPPAIPLSTPSADYLAWVHTREQKTFRNITLSATVYDHQITDLRYSGNGQACRVFSNIDFNNFQGTSEIETSGTIYDFVLMVGNQNSDSLSETWSGEPDACVQANQTQAALLSGAKQQLPILSATSQTTASYIVVSGSENSDALADLAAIHNYYNANAAQVVAAYQQKATEWAAAAEYQKEHPPVKQDTIINYWPVMNSAYLLSGTNGGDQ